MLIPLFSNRDSMTVNGVTTDYEYNALDQLTNIGSVIYDYDDRGNLSTITNGSQVTSYTYDAADRLTSATAPSVTASYGYDADGRRMTQTFNGQVTNSLWDEASAYGDVVYEYNSTGGALANYVCGDPLLGPGGTDIGAPTGWHVVVVDRFGNAWDNYGFHGSATKYISAITAENQGSTSATFSYLFELLFALRDWAAYWRTSPK